MKESVKGGKDYIEVAQGIQVSMIGANGQMKSTEQVFYDTIDALGGIEDATKRDIAAQEIFGKSYQDMKPLIDAGSEALLRYAAEAHAAGLILSDEAVAALGGFDEERERTRRHLEEARRRLASYRSREGGVFAFADELADKRRRLRDVDDALAAAAVECADGPAEAA